MNKKLVALCLCIAIIASALTAGTIAWFTAAESVENEFTVGNVKIDLTEPKWDETGKAEAEDVYPGEALAKDPTVENVGDNPCFVRIGIERLNQYGENNKITYRTDFVDGKLGEGWVLHTDGFFYYTKPLVVKGTEGGEWNEGLVSKTDALFDQIVMPTGLTNDMSSEAIVVTAYAVQAQGARASWSAVKAMTVEEIATWFNTAFPLN